MNALEASIEILKIVTAGEFIKGGDIDSKTDKVLENFQKIYHKIDSIVNQAKKNDSWGDTLEGIDLTLKSSREVIEGIDPTLKGSIHIDLDILGIDPTIKGSQQ